MKKQTDKKIGQPGGRRSLWLWLGITAFCALAAAGCLLFPWTGFRFYRGLNTDSLHYLPARVLSVERSEVETDEYDTARQLGGQTLTVELLAGENKGEQITLENYLTRSANVLARAGDTVILCEDLPESAAPYYTVYNYSRTPALLLMLALFAGAVLLVGGAKGLRTLLGLGFTGTMIVGFLLPAIYHGLPSLPVTAAVLAVCTAVCLLYLNPPGAKTLVAVLATLAGVALAGGLFQLFCGWLHLSGMNGDNGEGLVLVAAQTGLELHWLLLIAVLISSLGAVMDVCLSLASSLEELHRADGSLGARELFAAGMRIGRDMIGTMSNTLILAFTGEAVTTLLLLLAYGWQPQQLINSDYIGIQAAQGIASTMGVVLSVPITSAAAAHCYSRAARPLAGRNLAKAARTEKAMPAPKKRAFE